MLADKLRKRGIQVWVEDGNLCVKTVTPLTDEQRTFLRHYKPDLIEELTTPHGNRYMWRRKDPHNVAGWHVLYSYQETDTVQAMLGADIEVKPAPEQRSGEEAA